MSVLYEILRGYVLRFGLRVLSWANSKPVTQNAKLLKARKIITTVIKKGLKLIFFSLKSLFFTLNLRQKKNG